MPNQPREFTRPDPKAPFYHAVGRVAQAWAILEYTIDGAIWNLAQVSREQGACITAQLTGLLPRFRALIALAAHRGVSEETIKKLHRLSADSFSLNSQRNRIVHDMVLTDKETGIPVRFTVTADKKLDARYRPFSIEDADNVAEAVRKYEIKCYDAIVAVNEELAAS
jgi:hypothetical protein